MNARNTAATSSNIDDLDPEVRAVLQRIRPSILEQANKDSKETKKPKVDEIQATNDQDMIGFNNS